ncbi:MAG: putative transposase [Chloroflexia bacterium]|nr:putative transposase [Chloroflexia bacterium]
MSPKDFKYIFDRLNLPAAGQAIVERAAEKPSRRTRSSGGNVSGAYPSRKGWEMKAYESHTVEREAVVAYELDVDVINYYDQPGQIKLTFPHKNRKNYGVVHTPDFLVIRKHEIAYEEWKTEEKLEELAADMPNRYVRGEDGKWRCPPGEEFAAKYGMRYYLRSSAEINPVLQANLRYFDEYFRPKVKIVNGRKEVEPLVPDAEIKALAIELVSAHQGITFAELKEQIKGARVDKNDKPGLAAHTLNILILQEALYVNLLKEFMAPQFQDRAHVFLNKESARAYIYIQQESPWDDYTPSPSQQIGPNTPITWDGRNWTVVNPGQQDIFLLGADKSVVKFPHEAFQEMVRKGEIQIITTGRARQISPEGECILATANERAIRRANAHFEFIAPALRGGRLPKVSETEARRRRRLLKVFREAAQLYGCGYIGLIPMWANCGVPPGEWDEEVLRLMAACAERFDNPKNQTKKSVWNMLVSECEEKGLTAPSYFGFLDYINDRPKYEQEKARKGRRGAYDYEEYYPLLKLHTPRHGGWPFDVAHIDHTEAEIELIAYRGGKHVSLGRLWITFLVDSYSRRILAIYCSYDRPSYRSCMMVLRECLHRHGRLPQTVISDQGKEFENLYWYRLLSRYEIEWKVRPTKPRFGTVIERLFGTVNVVFFRNLRGNTHLMHDPRTVTKEVNPKNLAVWTLPDLYPELCHWGYEVYDTTPHPALGVSPREQFAIGIDGGGEREQRAVAYDDEFIKETMPSTRQGTARVSEGGWVKINYLRYSHPAMRWAGVPGTDVPVRYDPFNMGVAWAYIHDQWRECTSEHMLTFANRSEKEIAVATQKMRERFKLLNRTASFTAKSLGDFLRSLEGKEAVLMQRLKDSEVRKAQLHLLAPNTSPEPDQAPGKDDMTLLDSAAVGPETDAGADEGAREGLAAGGTHALSVQPRADNMENGNDGPSNRRKFQLIKER